MVGRVDSITTLETVRFDVEDAVVELDIILPQAEMDWEPIHYGIEVIRNKLASISNELADVLEELKDAEWVGDSVDEL